MEEAHDRLSSKREPSGRVCGQRVENSSPSRRILYPEIVAGEKNSSAADGSDEQRNKRQHTPYVSQRHVMKTRGSLRRVVGISRERHSSLCEGCGDKETPRVSQICSRFTNYYYRLYHTKIYMHAALTVVSSDMSKS